jgi:hypothetical protein
VSRQVAFGGVRWWDGRGSLADYVTGGITARGLVGTLAYDLVSRRRERRERREAERRRYAEGVTVWMGGAKVSDDTSNIVVSPHVWVQNANPAPVFLDRLRVTAFGMRSEDDLAMMAAPPRQVTSFRLGTIDVDTSEASYGWEVTRSKVLRAAGFEIEERPSNERPRSDEDEAAFHGDMGFSENDARYTLDGSDNESLFLLHRSALKHFAVEIAFMDPAGRTWCRDSRGRLAAT